MIRTDDVVRFEGYDANGHRRVYGDGYGEQQAADNCMKEAELYVVNRPDTGPLSGWRFELKKN